MNRDWELGRLEVIQKRLLEITKGCDVTMHEPDNQDVGVFMIFGNHLDNAFGADRGSGEFVVCLTKGDEGEDFNLADLLALARMAEVKDAP